MIVPFEYSILRVPERRTAHLVVTPANQVILTVAKRTPPEMISEILKKKTPWVLGKLHRNSQVKGTGKKEFVNGEAFPYLGRNYRLKIGKAKAEPSVHIVSGRIQVMLNGSKISKRSVRSALQAWYVERAQEKIRDRLTVYEKRIAVTPSAVHIRNLKSRWGSCTSRRQISFNWRIILAPISIVDYVIVHELCHLIHHDHSKDFWRSIERILPDYEERKEWLRVNGGQLEM